MIRTALVSALTLILGGYFYFTLQQNVERIQEQDEADRPIIPPTAVFLPRGPWYFQYHDRLVQNETTRNTFARTSQTTPVQLARLDENLRSSSKTAHQIATRDQLRTLMIALLNYNDIYGRLGPNLDSAPQYFDSNGQLHLSWRVHLLPLIYENDMMKLYQQFHLDEPYDSPHNIELIDQMPDIYRDVNDPQQTTVTRFQIVDGPGGLLEKSRFRSLKQLTRPPGEVLLIGVVPLDKATCWTKPENVVVNPSAPRTSFEPIPDQGFQYLSAEGSVLYFPPSGTDADFLKLVRCCDR